MAAPLWERLSPGPVPATPSLLYRSAFAEECEALATALLGAGESRLPPPSPSPTIETERLTPLCAASSFFSSFLTPQPPSGPPPRSPNRTYDEGLPSGVPQEEEEEKPGGRSPRLDLTFEWEPPALGPADPSTSTPAPAWAQTPDQTLDEEERGDSEETPPSSAPGKRLASAGKGRLPTRKKRRLSAGGTAAAATLPPPSSSLSRFPVPKGAPKGGKVRPSTGLSGPRSSWGAPAPSRPLAQKQLHDETRNSLTEAHHEKKSATSFQPLSQRSKKPVLGGSLACQGLKHQGENKPPRTKLPVPTVAGGTKTQKHPKEKEPATESAQKQIITKRVSQGTDLKWKHTGRSLLTARQISRAAPNCGSCLQCQELLQENQRLAEEIQHLKTLLENCQCRDGASQFVKCMVEVTSKV